MRVAESVIQPDSPPRNWGVVRRSRTVKDFTFVAIFSLIVVCLALFFTFYSALGLDLSSDEKVLIISALGFFILCLMIAIDDPGGAKKEAVVEGKRLLSEWQSDLFIPFLEAKYGMKLSDHFDLRHIADPRFGYKDGRMLEFRIHGINMSTSNINPRFDFSREILVNFELNDTIWIEEIVRPAEVSYRKIDKVEQK